MSGPQIENVGACAAVGVQRDRKLSDGGGRAACAGEGGLPDCQAL
jgi:hypothetical protein